MSWQDILKLDDYIERRLPDLKRQLERANPEDAELIQTKIKYWESIKNG